MVSHELIYLTNVDYSEVNSPEKTSFMINIKKTVFIFNKMQSYIHSGLSNQIPPYSIFTH